MKKIFSILILATLAFYACDKPKSKAKVETPDEDTIPKANMMGTVTQFNQYSSQYTVNLGLSNVSIDGTNFFTTTNNNGNYTLTGVPAGTYNVSFNKFGCGLWQQQHVVFTGKTNQFVSGYTVEKPSYLFTGINITDTFQLTIHKLYATISMTPVAEPSGVLIISGNNPNLDIATAGSYSVLTVGTVPANRSSYGFYQCVGASGVTYFKVYPYPSVGSARSYYDFASGRQVYTAYGDPGPTTYSILVP